MTVNLPTRDLTRDVDALFASQTAVWPDLARGLDGLRRARERRFDIGGFPITARHLPHRVQSTMAAVDPASVARRPCFLCPENRPELQRGIPFDGFEIFCNPFPILEKHLTIVCTEHVPQRIAAPDSARGFPRMLDLARSLPGLMLLYNGPVSGASAPDHLHFQAASASGIPVFDEGLEIEGGTILRYPGNVVVISGGDPEAILRQFRSVLGGLPVPDEIGEPMLNVASAYRAGQWEIRLFPRARHRPGVFERGEFAWSPGAIDMCGMAVFPVAGDLERLTVEVIESTYREVSLPAQGGGKR